MTKSNLVTTPHLKRGEWVAGYNSSPKKEAASLGKVGHVTSWEAAIRIERGMD
jgi:hypothetical protein